MPATAPVRPASIRLGDVSLFVVRGPHKADPLLWYWRARGPHKAELGTRWATVRDAETWAAQLLLGERGHVEEERCETVVDLLELYLHWQLNERSDIEENSRASSATTVKRLSRKGRGLRTVHLDRLDRGAVDIYVRSALAQGQAVGTTKLDLRVLKAAWAWGRREGLVPDRALDVPKLKTKSSRSRYTPSSAEVLAVLSRLEGRPQAILSLQAELGARLSEVVALCASDLTWPERWTLKRQAAEPLEDGWVTLGRHAGARKTGARRVPLSAYGFELIEKMGVGPAQTFEAQRGEDTRVFGICQKYARTSVSAALQRAIEACGQPPWTSHALRRATVRRLIASGQEISVAAELLGHSKVIMLEAYDQTAEVDLVTAARAVRLGALLDLPTSATEGLCP